MYKKTLSVIFFQICILGSLNCFAQTPGINDSLITFGQSAAFKGTSSALGSELWRGSEAYFKEINSQGGIQKRKIKILSLDDGYEGKVTLTNTIKLISREKVFGLYGYVGTPTIVRALPVIQKFSRQGIFLFSNFTGAQPQREPPHNQYVFNIRSSYRQETAGLVQNFVKIGYKNFGVFIQSDAYGKSGADGVSRALKNFGLKILGEATYERGIPYNTSMTAQVDVLRSKNVEVVISIGSYEACAAFIRDLRLSGFEGPVANVSFVGADSLLQLLKEEEKRSKKKITTKLVNSQVVPPWSDITVPLVKEYRELIDKHNPQVPHHLVDPGFVPAKYSFVSLEGFLNAKVLVEVLKRAPQNLTRRNFVETIENINDLDVGLGHKVSFNKTKHQGLNAVFFTTIENGKYVSVNDWTKLK